MDSLVCARWVVLGSASLSSSRLRRSCLLGVLLLAQLFDRAHGSEHDFRFDLRSLRNIVAGTVIGHCTGCVPVVVVVIRGTGDVPAGIADEIIVQVAIAITILALIRHDLIPRTLDVRLCFVSLFVEPKTEEKEVQRWPNDFSLLALRKLSGPEKKKKRRPRKLLVAVSYFSLLALR